MAFWWVFFLQQIQLTLVSQVYFEEKTALCLMVKEEWFHDIQNWKLLSNPFFASLKLDDGIIWDKVRLVHFHLKKVFFGHAKVSLH